MPDITPREDEKTCGQCDFLRQENFGGIGFICSRYAGKKLETTDAAQDRFSDEYPIRLPECLADGRPQKGTPMPETKPKHTQGPCVVNQFGWDPKSPVCVLTEKGEWICTTSATRDCAGRPWTNQNEEVELANADLIAEAFNAAHETGFTPRQLLEQRNVLLAACELYDAKITAYYEGRILDCFEVWPVIRAAIAQTKGEPHA
jgi:hypothetical protein